MFDTQNAIFPSPFKNSSQEASRASVKSTLEGKQY